MLLDKFVVCYRKIDGEILTNPLQLTTTWICALRFHGNVVYVLDSLKLLAEFKSTRNENTVEGDRALNVVFLDNEENEASVPDIGFLNRRPLDFKIGYLSWLAGLTEQINASLNHRLCGKWRI